MLGLPFPDISPIAFEVFGFGVRWYSLAYLAGFLLGWRYILFLIRNQSERPNTNDVEDFFPWAVIGVILGGRLGYVLFYNPVFYLNNPLEIFQVWQGGMAFHGGALGVIIALFLFSWQQKINVLRLGDVVCAAVPIGLFFGRLANFINGELYGRISEVSWAIRFPAGGFLPRHPSQLYEAILEGVFLFVLLFFVYRVYHKRPGMTAGLFLAGYGMSRFVVEYFREPDPQYGLFFDVISMGQILSLPMILVGGALTIYTWKRGQNESA